MKNEPASMRAAGISSQKLQRNHPVRKAHEGRHDGAEHHDQAVHRGERIEQLGVEELQARLEQLGADAQRQDAADHQHGEREQQVHRADVLVVRGEHPAAPAVQRAVVVVVVVTVVVRPVLGEDGAHGRCLSAINAKNYLRAATTSAG